MVQSWRICFIYCLIRDMGNDRENGFKGILNFQRIKELRLCGFFLFLLWPLILIIALSAIIYTFIKEISANQGVFVSKDYKVYLFLINLPYHLSRFALKEKNIRLLLSILLLFPLMLTTILCIPLAFSSKISPTVYASPQPPNFYSWFGIEGKGLLGTNAEGAGIANLIILGAWHTYFVSLSAACVVLVFGLLLGVLTFTKRKDALVMFFVETLESVPGLFFLLILLAVFSWWEDAWKSFSAPFPNIFSFLRDTIIGSGIGFCFLPRMVRLVREKIKTFTSENFIDAAKAHGINENKILWFHIIKKNCLNDIVITITEIWAAVILLEISLDYLASISTLLGVKIYTSWAQMLLTQEAKEAIIFFKDWWLYAFPGFFIISTITGFYLFGDSLRILYEQRFIKQEEDVTTDFDAILEDTCAKIGLTENA